MGEWRLEGGKYTDRDWYCGSEDPGVTLVNIAQGVAETQLTNQMRRMILLAFPMEERERGERGRQIARYLNININNEYNASYKYLEKYLSNENATIVRIEA